jgi:uncharacterized protein
VPYTFTKKKYQYRGVTSSANLRLCGNAVAVAVACFASLGVLCAFAVNVLSIKRSDTWSTETMTRAPENYWNPYKAGTLLGLVLLAAFVIMGRGLGVSGAVTTTVAAGIDVVAPAHAQANVYAAAYLGDGNASPFKDWLVMEVLGVLIGGLVSALLAGRFRWQIEKGPRISGHSRLLAAFGGGAVMGFATRVARGCTSGQALTGGAMLSVGSWVFMLAIFAGAYATATLVRKQWT